MKKLFVLDVSGFVFRAYFALPEMRGPKGESTQAVFGFIRSLDKLINDRPSMGRKRTVACCSHTLRLRLTQGYKHVHCPGGLCSLLKCLCPLHDP
ncbi:hypothetical protein, partial [Chlamydia suis]|uniref:hypothetical protein n=1 Tax=Chlamydia suis TaxID=83559 RepID=UPI002150FF11